MLRDELLKVHGVELDPTDVVRLEQNYCEPTIVDVVVEDTLTGRKCVFEWFDTTKGIFIY